IYIHRSPANGAPLSMASDRTKLTLRSKYWSGLEIRDALWNLQHVKIQVNKFAYDSILMMFMPGFTDRSSALLRTAMEEVIERGIPPGMKAPSRRYLEA